MNTVDQRSVVVLVLDGESKHSLTTIRSLAKAGYVVGTAVGRRRLPAVCNATRFAAFRNAIRDYTDTSDGYAEDVLDLVRRYRVRVVVPTMDASTSALLPYRQALRDLGATLAVGSDIGVAIAHDKQRTLQIAEDRGIPVPRGDAISDVADIASVLKNVGLPAVVKPALSWAAGTSRWTPRGVVVNSAAEGAAAITKSLASGSPALVQEYLPGAREQIHVLAVDGRATPMLAIVEHRSSPLLGGVSSLRETVPLPSDSARYAQELIEAIGLDGCSDVEFRRAADGRPVLMEVNARLSGSIEAAVLAGVNLPVMLVEWALGLMRTPSGMDYRTGVRLRDLELELRWLLENFQRPDEPDAVSVRSAALTFVRDSFTTVHYDYARLNDPVPAFVNLAVGTMKLFNWAGRGRATRSLD